MRAVAWGTAHSFWLRTNRFLSRYAVETYATGSVTSNRMKNVRSTNAHAAVAPPPETKPAGLSHDSEYRDRPMRFDDVDGLGLQGALLGFRFT